MATSSKPNPRILTRGEPSQFRVGFFADDNMTIPLEPINPQYPSYTIYDIEGTAIQTGVGVMVSPGNYRLDFQVPKDAKLSYFQQAPQQFNDQGQGAPLTADETRYRIEWMMLTADNYQVQRVEEFDIRDVAVTQSLSRELKYLTMFGDPVRVLYRNTVIPYMARVRVIVRGDDENPIFEGLYDSTQPPDNQLIKIVKDGDSYVLYSDLANDLLARNTCYLVLWRIQETIFSVPVTEFQSIVCISSIILPMITGLRMLIDKYQKRIGRLQAYEDSDLLEYISQGNRLVNLSYPTTSYGVDSMPDDLQVLVLLAAGWYGLKAQGLLENDAKFDFSGQSVTLSVDRTSGIDSAASAMIDMFNQLIGPAKMAYVRQARGVGTTATRAYSYRQQYNYSVRISHSGSGSADFYFNVLSKIGLL